MITRHDLETTLAALLPRLSVTCHPWWILGSAAVVLHGGDPDEVLDVDVLLDRRDVPAVFAALGLTPRSGVPDGKFRSEVFHRWNLAALPVELFAGFCLFEQGGWHELVPQTRVAIAVGEGMAYVPDQDELTAILRRFGRPKDQRRIAALSRISPSPSRSESA
ncbi:MULTISPECIES: hypothetical protein [unclassified Novosphingobium]|uniref:hypothetical protein n=1 Tax=unclassified Novosphingobium TaxID=2644732 RepID=UPI0025F61C9F|nr:MULTISPECIES: hypothetical protein [unclassified Novosphingobium]HQV04165.1 hypothetical protein [Novosphingobium sp.]